MMRKFLLFCLALVMATVAVPAFAATSVEFSGYLNVFHENLVNFNRDTDPNVEKDSDSFFANKLQVSLKIHPTDDITVHWTMRSVPYTRWGAIGIGGGGPDTTGIFTRNLYAEVRQPWGTLIIGRTADGTATNVGGLNSLGYAPAWGYEFLYANPFDIADQVDGLAWSKEFDNGFALAAFYTKDKLQDGNPINNPPNPNVKDQDRDRFGIEPRYSWGTGGVSLGLVYIRDMTLTDTINGNPYTVSKYNEFHLNPAFANAWGPFSIHFEADIAWGKATFTEDGNPTSTDTGKAVGLGLYLDAVYNYGAGDITLATWYVDGDAYNDVDKGHDLVTMGDFAPFLVAYHGWTLGTGNHDNLLPNSNYVNNGNDNGNHWGIGILGNHAITDDIAINYGLGYFRLVAPQFENQGKTLGFEIDLGARFQILDNLHFETLFGYMFNGNAYRLAGDNRDPDDTFAWSNVLTVDF
jgi:hypothetical protein